MTAILSDAVAAAQKRRVGQAWMFDRISSGPALTAAVLAFHGEQHPAPEPEKRPNWFAY